MSHPVILIFTRKSSSLNFLMSQFRKLPFKKIIQIHNADDTHYTIRRLFSKHPWFNGEALLLLSSLLIGMSIYYQTWIVTGLLALFFMTCYALLKFFERPNTTHLVERYQNLVMREETLILVECHPSNFETFIKVIQKVPDEAIAFFSTVDQQTAENINKKESLPHPLATNSELEKQARVLAKSEPITFHQKNLSQDFLLSIKTLNSSYNTHFQQLSNLASYNKNLQLSAEWLLDNSYTVKQSLHDIQKNLPENYFSELPFITEGLSKGAPRLYSLVSKLVSASDGRVTIENMTLFLNAYQEVKNLTMGELWAFPLILKIRLIECLIDLTLKVLNKVKENQLADFWANRILYASRVDPENLYSILSILSKEMSKPTTYFADQLMIQLMDTEAANAVLIGWLERKIGGNLHDIIQAEQERQTLEQTSIANVVSSLRRLEQINWREVFENISLVEKILAKDPAEIYFHMDFSTKDHYRHAIEKLAKHQKIPEEAIAEAVVKLGQTESLRVKRHVGYYLIDAGKTLLDEAIHRKASTREYIQHLLQPHLEFLYLFSCLFFTVSIALIFFSMISPNSASFSTAFILIALSIIPFSEIAIQLLNYTIAQFTRPHLLPKMFYQKGLPEESRTLVVIPSLIDSIPSIIREIEHLEIHFLANTDPQIGFGILVDFTDSPTENQANDVDLIQQVKNSIRSLNDKYPNNNFYLFLRQRQFNSSEKTWMGWERKRGKLENLNSFLNGSQGSDLDTFLQEGESLFLASIRYVLTVDSDTQLPKNSVRRLVETLSHPLNQGQIDPVTKKLIRGYTIIQPRVSTNYLCSHSTWFAKLFSDPSGIDPYTKSTSDVYQDLFYEGIYHGKGLYDHKIFHQVLSERLPENKILSHDLLEGAYVKVAFTSDIELYDSFPETYALYSKRQHRWIRGDWQLLSWLRKNVPTHNGKGEISPLSLINRWKILDNLRHSLLPVTALATLLFSWMTAYSLPWTLLIIFVMALPIVLRMIDLSRITFKLKLKRIWNDLHSSFIKTLIWFAFLPHQAWLNIGAISKTLYRQYFSHHHLLQWTLSSTFTKKDHQNCYVQLISISILAVFGLAGLIIYQSDYLVLKMSILSLWILSPILCKLLNAPYLRPQDSSIAPLSEQYIRLFARKIWRYFDDFVDEASHYLPPDNYQEKLKIEVAYRTSPTNIGLYMTSIISSHCFGYITSQTVIQRLIATVTTLKSLERYRGHFLNWYDIKNISPLLPKYVSTVDSGNLLASFWAAEEKCKAILDEPIIDPSRITSAIHDTLQLFYESLESSNIKQFSSNFQKLSDLAKSIRHTAGEFRNDLETLKIAVQYNLEITQKNNNFPLEATYWLQKLETYLLEIINWFDLTMPWISLCDERIAKKMFLLHPEGDHWKKITTEKIPTLRNLVNKDIEALIPTEAWIQKVMLDEEMKKWLNEFIKKINQGITVAEAFETKTNFLIKELREISSEMDLTFLYNPERKLFSIGYNVSDQRLDNSCYDLLASEARLASFIAIAKNDVPLEHWWALGRPTTEAFGTLILQSWGGTMFEYLMPVIWCKNFKNTLLDYACKAAVKCQIAYGNQLGIPWGISESAYSRLDIHNIYQYRAFGVPYLGLKQGLESDFVVTPYSSALALMIDPTAAIRNLKKLDNKEMMSGPYGFFEAIDYSREHRPDGKHGIIIHTYMAHHLGMSICSICNALFEGYIQKLFHAHPRVKALETILYERLDIVDGKAPGRAKEQVFPKLLTSTSIAGHSHFDTPLTPVPVTHLLSNGNYSLLMTNSGSGYSKYQTIDLTRWRIDATCDNWGTCFYIKDVDRNTFFSTANFPIQNSPSSSYYVNFSNHKVDIIKTDKALKIATEIVVSPEDNVEVRYMTLSNQSMRYRQLEITSYLEIALAEHKADLMHPAFSKMFIETEPIHSHQGLLAHRRQRSPKDSEQWCFHIVAVNAPETNPFSYETERNIFIGYNRTLANPEKISKALSNSHGFVLDPIFAIRKKIPIEAGKQIKLSFITGYTTSRNEAIKLMEKYKNIETSTRVLDMAWTHAELDLRRLHITHNDAHLFQRLANFMIYPDAQLRGSADLLKANRLGQEQLWKHGISGDHPILLVTIEDIYNLEIVQNALQAHAFWSLRGLVTDVVILNKEKTSYEQPLNDHLIRMAQSYSQYTGLNTHGGIFLLEADKLSSEDLNLLYAVAHAILVAERGNLSQQLAMPRHATNVQSLLKANPLIQEHPSPSLPFLELLFFNGIGGFTPDGREYAILFEREKTSLGPWINVICNKNFGFLASAHGLGMTWCSNSQMNRLTPWSNDPLLNPITDVCYIRDDESGKFWTITYSPIHENDPFRARHGNGYTVYEHNSHGIEQEMTIFTPLDETHTPIRIQILKLTNRSSKKRKLSIFNYVELTLGADREESQRHIETSWNYETNTLIATNRYRSQFANHVTFLHSLPSAISFTGSRKDFIGRNLTTISPDALKRSKLSRRTGVAMDPCFALQLTVELYSNESTECIFLLGECTHMSKAKEICQYYQKNHHAHEALDAVKTWWNQLHSKLHVTTPDVSLNLLFNRWLTYQNLSCRMWGRSAFYQSGGAYGFRDQLQDSTALIYLNPLITKEQILKSASHQFVEGDVQHWWHEETGSGVRTKISDDLLWLPYVVLHYMEITSDESIMDIEVSYLEGRLLNPNEHEAIVIPTVSEKKGSIHEHCQKAIEKSLAVGPHGLPLIGCGDWNDGMNLVGIKESGESVWLAWFLIYILKKMSAWLISKGDNATAERYMKHATKLHSAIETHAWDGSWYLRAFFDDGTPIGSHLSKEDQIDSLSQSWAVINGLDNERTRIAMESVEKKLIDEIHRLVLLFTPPYDKAVENPGYIKGYPPGVRENGGQYTHAAIWVAMAFAKLGEGDKAMNILQMINPINRTKTLEEVYHYRVEPYVTAADIYALPGQEGRGGWTWYTGSASLMYRTILEDIFGFKLTGELLTLDPCIPTHWDFVTLNYWHGESFYEIHIENPQRINKGVVFIELDQERLKDFIIPLTRSAGKHFIKVMLGI